MANRADQADTAMETLGDKTAGELVRSLKGFNARDVAAANTRRVLDAGGGNGGGAAGGLVSADFTFEETVDPGTYTATLDLLEGSVVVDVWFWTLADWDADTALMDAFLQNVGAVVYLDGVDVATGDPTVLNSAQVIGNGSGPFAGPTIGLGVELPADDILTLTVTTLGPGGTTGRLRAKVLYYAPSDEAVAAVKS